ncbi:M56 family metallopeptidase [Hymenobacter properus]|uniref:TonB family protein n=1 Tax=Hymenobacter properus TaxID=2791026 RepID=A0A931BGF2_9BACT|nr:M56 family metallopeptidase [Hymenobacter properus]MBF9143044.1 TonB family protein [Hymenobacter properus]MBR7721852.1 TonB family protein [Microvirga sp. SRT04]
MNQISLLNWMLLSTGLLGACWLCYRLALRQERSFAYNRWYLVLGPVLAAGLPLLPVAWPASWGVGPAPLAGVASVLLPVVAVSSEGATAPPATWPLVLLLAYLAGVAFMLGRLALELGQLWGRTRRLAREKREGYTLVPTHGAVPTSSFGRLVFWDNTLALSPAEADQVLRHECAHVRQGHTYDRLLLELLRAGLWFNPFVHLCGRALALTHEYLADEEALRHAAAQAPAFAPAISYTHLLARQVASRLGFSIPLAHTFSHSQTLRRIAMIQKTSPVRRWKQWLALPLLGALVFTVACERSTDEVAPNAKPAVTPVNATASETSGKFYDGDIPPPPPPAIAGSDAPAVSSIDRVYTYVEQMPQLPGGGNAQAIAQYLQSHTKYTDDLRLNPKEGVVFAKFTVTETGEVKDITIVKGLSRGYDHAVLDAIRTLPRFIPGRQDGKAVAVSFTVPVRFVTKAPANSVGLQLINWYGNWGPKQTGAGC